LKTNRVVWQRQFNEGCRSGSMVTAGGVVFMGRTDGRIIGLDASNGERLWEFRTDAPINSGITTFLHEGKQYIAAYAGGGLFGALKGDGVWLFSLDGTLNQLPPPTAAGPAGPALTAPEGRVADIDAGRTLYKQSCVYCHGDTGTGGHGGGAELTSALAVQDIITMLSTGRNAMPNFRPVMTVEQMHDIATYVTEELVKE
jgi:mono/diheme cytochrome c family protein